MMSLNPQETQFVPNNTDWFHDAKWGVFTHYLGAPPSTAGGAELTAEMWNAQVDAFDVPALVEQLVSTGCGYYFITIGQNSGHYCAPNATYDRLVGIEPSKCSRRDLVAELAEALERHGIPLLVYLPSGAPAADHVARRKLKWLWGAQGGWQLPGEPIGGRLAEFQRSWEAICRDWSLRWGRLVRGWWIDGCYFADAMYRHEDEPNFASFAAALKAGNPDALVAFNPGVLVPVICHTEHEDYTAGEIAEALPTCPGRWACPERSRGVERGSHKAQYHILSYLGSTWCGGDRPRFGDDLAAAYTRYVTSRGGVVTWDVPILTSGLLPRPFVDQLRAIGRSMEK